MKTLSIIVVILLLVAVSTMKYSDRQSSAEQKEQELIKAALVPLPPEPVIDTRSSNMPPRYVAVEPVPSQLKPLRDEELQLLKQQAYTKQTQIETLVLELNEQLSIADNRTELQAQINNLKGEYNKLILPVIMHEMKKEITDEH